MTNHKNISSEDAYFAAEDAEKLHRLAQEKHKEKELHIQQTQKALHYMKCPKCGDNLRTVQHHFVEIDECPTCGVIVLDKGELDKIIRDETSILKSFVDVFRKG